MRLLLIILLFFLNFNNLIARQIGETEIIAEDGIEVFQIEKYYLLKKNVKINSDNFILRGDEIKIFFNNDLYDIKIIDAKGNVDLNSDYYNIKANGESLYFEINEEKLRIKGINSKLITEDTVMLSDGEINVNNSNGEFDLYGANSELKSENIIIKGNKINGVFSNNNNKEVSVLYVFDENIAYVENDNTQMFAKNIRYNKETSLIELEDKVKIHSKGEIITGDYGTLNTETNAYKIKSKDSNKVKVIISNKNE